MDKTNFKRKRKNRHKDFWFNEFESLDFDSTKEIDLYRKDKERLQNEINELMKQLNNNRDENIKQAREERLRQILNDCI